MTWAKHPPERAGDHRQQQAFRQQLANQARPAGAERDAHRHFRGASGGAGQQQTGDIGARDHQNSRADAEHNPQGAPNVTWKLDVPVAAGVDQQRPLAILLLDRLGRHRKAPDQLLFIRVEYRGEARLHLGTRGSRREPAQNAEPAPVGSLNAALLYIMAGIQMSTNFPGSTPKKPFARDSDDGEVVASDSECAGRARRGRSWKRRRQ